MKPVKLVIEGINSFTDAQTLDFEAVGRSNLFCISGKTGAGKTTIFDSIMLALYGRSGKGNLADVVNLSRMSARVALDFTENGDLYSVERTIDCKLEKNSDGVLTDKRVVKKTDCMLYKNGEPIAVGSDAANAVISDIIGLAESEFKNVYLLEQGEYADFLKKPPAKQTEAVGKIFSLMRFGEVHRLANERFKSSSDDAERLEKQIEAMGDISQKTLRDEKSALSSLKARTTNIIKETEEKRKKLDGLQKVRDEYISVREKQHNVKTLMLEADEAEKKAFFAEQAFAEFESTVDNKQEQALSELRERLNALSALNTIDKEYAAAVKDAAQKAEAADKKRAALMRESEKHARLLEKSEDDDKKFKQLVVELGCAADAQNKSAALISAQKATTVAEITEAGYALASELEKYNGLVAERDSLASSLEQKAKAKKVQLEIIEKYEAELKSLAKAKAEAEQKYADAQAALNAAQLCSHAAAVRAELRDGDVCPVCGGTFTGGGSAGDTDVEKRKRECETAKVELDKATESEAKLINTVNRAKADYEHIDGEARDLDERLKQMQGRIAQTGVQPDVYNKVMDLLAKAKVAGERARLSAEQAKACEPVISAAGAEAEAATAAAAEAAQKAEGYKAQLGDNCGKTDDVIKEIKLQTAEIEKQIEKTQNMRKKLSADVEAAKAAVAAKKESLAAAKANCPVDIPQFDEEAYNERKEEIERLNKQIAQNEKDIAVKEVEIKVLSDNLETLEKLASERSLHLKQAKIFEEIVQLTKGKAMLNYVAEEYIALFTAAASEILSDLSGGKYTMRYDSANGFVVSDYLNDGKSRKTDTLSGGELFLASLSVAIAIARTQSNGNNAFFFLDEGFGTLDDELIDTVYGALESLSKDCLVGVISHAGALIDRMPACVEVIEATDTMGSRIKY